MNQQKIFDEAIKKYGFENQLNQLTEECGELIVAVNKFRRNGIKSVHHLVEELADVKMMIQQIEHGLCLKDDVENAFSMKLVRLKNRLSKF